MADRNDSDPGISHASIEKWLREFVHQEFRGIYTLSMVVVESVDESTRRAVVTLKSDSDVPVDNVPIASPFATDGGGMITPVNRGDEGLLLHAKEPLEQKIQRHGEETPRGERRFTLEAGVLLPLIWLDEDDVPEHEDGEYQIALPGDGSVFRLLPDGRVRFEHPSGRAIAMDADGHVTIGETGNASPVLKADVSIEYEDTQPDGTVETKTATLSDDGETSDFEAS